MIQGLKQLDGIVFAARIMVEPASDPQYKDANKLANVVLPGEPQYAAIMRGETVAADPVNASRARRRETAAQAPAWSADPAGRADKPWAAPSAPPPARPAGAGRLSTCGKHAVRRSAQRLSPMTDDEWQAHVTREAAKAIGTWLEGRGRLHQPIAALTIAELEAMATNAICRFVVLGSQRINGDHPEDARA